MNRWNTAGQFDELGYVYENNFPNRLRRVDDSRPNNTRSDDIDDQSGTNYDYDEIGQLISDASESQAVTWDIYGKVRTLDNGLQTMEYRYDGHGNRVYKKVTDAANNTTITWYVRDAQGNILSIYESSTGNPLTQKEAVLYGSSRLGTHTRNIVANQNAPAEDFDYLKDRKKYELGDHKNSIYSVVSDLKFFDGIRYSPIQKSYSDLYPGGWEIKERSNTTAGNTFGYEGQLKDAAWNGDPSGSIEYSARTMDTRIIRMRSVDPLRREYPGLSPYSVGMNRLIDGAELEGMEYKNANDEWYYEMEGGIVTQKTEDTWILTTQNYYRVYSGGSWSPKYAYAQKNEPKYYNYQLGDFAQTVSNIASGAVGLALMVPASTALIPATGEALVMGKLGSFVGWHSAAGVGIEMSAQLAFGEGNLQQRFNNMDIVDVGVSGLQGGYLAGANRAAKLGVLVGGELFKSTFNFSENRGFEIESGAKILTNTSIGVATAYGGEFISKGIGAYINRGNKPALKRLELELSRSMKKSKGEADRLKSISDLQNQIKGNEISSEVIGTGASEYSDDKLKEN